VSNLTSPVSQVSQLRLDARDFAQLWAHAWNSRDVEAVLAHFDEDVVFTSPVAIRIGFAADGVVRGKAALRDYWGAALTVNPELRFTVTNAFAGVQTIVIAYVTQTGQQRVEVLTFRGNLVVEGHGLVAA
jgi:ketosteroid isomerase-like protein